jgi:hypothetical protein
MLHLPHDKYWEAAVSFEEKLHSFLGWLKRSWSPVAGTVAALGFLAKRFLPPGILNPSWDSFFDGLGLGAIIWMLVEIRGLISTKERYTPDFPNINSALPEIGEKIRKEIADEHRGTVEIQVFGSKLQTMFTILNPILTKIAAGKFREAHNARFTIYGIDPDFLASYATPPSGDSTTYAGRVKNTEKELEDFNGPVLAGQGVSVEVIRYRTFPFIYAVLIGDKYIYVGFMTWTDGRDFEPNDNHCYRLDANHRHYKEVKTYLENRAGFYNKQQHKAGGLGLGASPISRKIGET